MTRRTRAFVLIAGLAIVGVAVVVYAFGTPQAPVTVAQTSAATQPSGADGGADVVVTSDEVPEPDPDSPLAIQIPGCTCHSDDPQVVEEHAQYRMNQCFGCHAEGVPGMGQ